MKLRKFLATALILALISGYAAPASAAVSEEKVMDGLLVTQTGAGQYQGQPFNSNNVKVVAVYSDNTEREISDKEYDLFGYKQGESGKQTVTIAYGGMDAELDITVKESDFIYQPGQEVGLELKTNHISSVTWEVSDSSVIQILDTSVAYVWESTSSGMYTGYKQTVELKALKPGLCRLSCRSSSGTVLSYAMISVNKPIESFELNKQEVFLKEGDVSKLDVSILPEDADEKRVSWTSSDRNVVSVDRNGNLEGLKIGDAVVKAHSWNGTDTGECNVHVVKPAEKIELDKTQISFNSRETQHKIKAELYPQDATFKALKYKSADETVATVDDDGTVRAVGNGHTEIIVSSEDGFASASLKVNVAGLADGINVKQDRLDFSEVGQKIQIDAAVTPDDALNKNLIWQSSDPAVVSVDQNGLATAVSLGTAQITVKSEDGDITKTIPAEVHDYCKVIFRSPDIANGLVNLDTKTVKWGDAISIGEMPRKGYSYIGTYEQYDSASGFDGKIRDGSKVTITGDKVFYVDYKEIKTESIELKLPENFRTGDDSFTVLCFSKPEIVADESFTLSSSNQNIAVFNNGSSHYEYYGYNSDQDERGPGVFLAGEGDLTLTSSTPDGSCSDRIQLVIRKTNFNSYFVAEKGSPEAIMFADQSKARLYGNNRYDTSIRTADALKKAWNISKFDNIIVADGRNYADALAGSYLAKVKNAPILLVGSDSGSQQQASRYISQNLKTGGTVYILGGTGAVSANFENMISTYDVKRLAGDNRWLTNIEILKEAGVNDGELVVCSGMDFADSLSASSVGKPILLVDDKVYSQQISYLHSVNIDNIYIIGGTGAVNNTVANTMKKCGSIKRIAGQNRYETSVAVANRFFGEKYGSAMFAYGDNFPDGLSGSPLAMALDAPLILINNRNTDLAGEYAENMHVYGTITLGGPSLISETAIRNIMNR